MSNSEDIRWKQRFQNYQRALARLTGAVDVAAERPLNDLEQQGLIQAFEFTHELAWNTLKDFLKFQGVTQDIIGSRDATRLAFADGLITDGDTWMEMIKSRNKTSHTYNEEVANEIAGKTLTSYHAAFTQLETRLLVHL